MKVAWISYEFLEYSALHVNAINKEHEVLAILPKAECDEEEYVLDEGVQRFLFHKPRLRQPFKQYQSIKSIRKRLFDFAPDVVHFQQAHLWFSFSLKRIHRNFPLVVTIHDPRHHSGDTVSRKTPQWVVDHGFKQADHVIVHGRNLVETVCQLFGFDHETVHMIPHVAMGQMSQGGQIDHNLTDPNMILFFGRIWDYKGLQYLIEAEPLISEECPGAKIHIVGEGDNFEKYRRLMTRPERFSIHNDWVDDEQRARYFERAGVVVLPYTDATQSGVVPVAHNFGKPVVATNVGALSESVRDGETGLLVPPKNPAELAKAIIKLLKNPDLARQMGQIGRDKLLAECSPEAVASRHIETYRKAVASRTH